MSNSSELSSISKRNHIPGRVVFATKTVKSLSINDLCKKYYIKNCNLLQIDTEGYDAKIINSIDFSITKPLAICFEHMHCLKQDLEKARKYLQQNSYQLVLENEYDCLYQLSELNPL